MEVPKLLRVHGSICGILSRGSTLAVLKLMRVMPVISDKSTRIIACPKDGQMSLNSGQWVLDAERWFWGWHLNKQIFWDSRIICKTQDWDFALAKSLIRWYFWRLNYSFIYCINSLYDYCIKSVTDSKQKTNEGCYLWSEQVHLQYDTEFQLVLTGCTLCILS